MTIIDFETRKKLPSIAWKCKLHPKGLIIRKGTTIMCDYIKEGWFKLEKEMLALEVLSLVEDKINKDGKIDLKKTKLDMVEFDYSQRGNSCIVFIRQCFN